MKIFPRKCQVSPICLSPCVIVIGLEGPALSKALLASCLLLGKILKCIESPSLMQVTSFSLNSHICVSIQAEKHIVSGMALNMILIIKLSKEIY